MSRGTQFYIDGKWVDPVSPNLLDVVNPATEEVAGQISLGSSEDVDLAVAAARRAYVGIGAVAQIGTPKRTGRASPIFGMVFRRTS
jgi:acyl-CoA reductase-like NAD-dependent aldehyde dehydrogenase